MGTITRGRSASVPARGAISRRPSASAERASARQRRGSLPPLSSASEADEREAQPLELLLDGGRGPELVPQDASIDDGERRQRTVELDHSTSAVSPSAWTSLRRPVGTDGGPGSGA